MTDITELSAQWWEDVVDNFLYSINFCDKSKVMLKIMWSLESFLGLPVTLLDRPHIYPTITVTLTSPDYRHLYVFWTVWDSCWL